MIKSFIILVFFCCIATNLLGQNYGVPQRGQRGYSPPPRTTEATEPTPPDVFLLSQERANMYQELMTLDNFQKEILKSFLQDYYKKTSSIAFDANLKIEDKQKGVNAEKKVLEKKLLDIFSVEQVEIIMTEEQFGTKSKEFKKEKRKEEKKKRKEKTKRKA